MSKKGSNTFLYVLIRQGLINWKSAIVIISLAVFLGIVGNSASDVLDGLIALGMNEASAGFPWTSLVLLLSSTGLMLGFVWFLLRKMTQKYREASIPTVKLDDGPSPKVLILFVSAPPFFLRPRWPGTADTPITDGNPIFGIHMNPSGFPVPENLLSQTALITPDFASWSRSAARDTPENSYYQSWRMPLEAIQYLRHPVRGASRLEQIVLIPSADTFLPGHGPETAVDGKPPKGWNPGSHHNEHQLKGLILEMLGAESGIRVDVLADVLRGDTILSDGSKSSVVRGIPFGDIEAVAITLDRLWHYFTNRHGDAPYGEDEIVVDTTGGLAVTSVAAAAYTLKHPRRRIIYVDTNTYQTKSYNVIHNLDEMIAEAESFY
ncbi:hypothetical protein [Puniceibacterium sediminis]|uniref:Uncharacterized protein n=1 Tax=Puniceibacterium sediminis TaxID=1608407 RepID=A0A238WG00_9RHOB|nr:hypothetical protein [Puniceibacterium sediminis]SNR44609.1 hypothetical protein SAMN06265370_105131 [Puniceibacterium sediminis]